MNSGVLGIDAGGTFTDLVFLSREDMKVVASAKVPTRHDDLPSTIDEGIALILRAIDGRWIESVHLASTLATNATVENKMAPAGLLLIGYDEDDVALALERKRFGNVAAERIAGGHDIKGNELEPLDERRLIEVCGEMLEKGVCGLAVSGYFAVRNPSHELRARQLILERYPELSVTCGHELASELDAFKRATTASINAGLIPILMRLLEAVRDVLRKLGIDAPLSVIKGDGALVSDEWAARHPVETVVSGPAASAMGARLLGGGRAGEGRTSWIVDIGGTTTDIIGLDRLGNPLIREEGADIGGHHILVKTIDIRTFGLGGDSRVTRSKDGSLQIGPRRVIPFAVAAEADPRVLALLREMEGEFRHPQEPKVFLPGSARHGESSLDAALIEKLAEGPATLETLGEGVSLGTAHAIAQSIEKYEDRGILQSVAFTPTDALLALGRMDKWPGAASAAAARLFAKAAGFADYTVFCQEVCKQVSALAAGEVFRKAMDASGRFPGGELDEGLLRIALRPAPDQVPDVLLRLNANLIGVGAPAWAFLGESAAMLGETARLPGSAAVAGAIGAAAGTFFMHHNILITPLKSGDFRVHLPCGIEDFSDLEEAVSRSTAFMAPWLRQMARDAGGGSVTVEWERRDEIARISGGTQEVLLWSRILFTVRDESEPS